MMSGNCDFATFCYLGDHHLLHTDGQLKKQVESNNYDFNNVIVVYQVCPFGSFNIKTEQVYISNIDRELLNYGIDIDKKQYQSPTDMHHNWKFHVVNHIKAIQHAKSEYIVFADIDCWMIENKNCWVEYGINVLQNNKDVFIVSPNDGQPERKTSRMSQQMFLVNVEDFKNADLNQPDWNGKVKIPNGPLPEYWAMLEGRMDLYCKSVDRYRYVCPPHYRYWHHNRFNSEGHFETDYEKY